MKELGGRVAVVTGAASGIGLGMARAFAGRGMKVVLADVEQPALANAVRTLADEGADVRGVECDVSTQASVDALARQALEAYGAVHVLCNNAGVGVGNASTWEATLDDWNWVLGVNLWGVIHGVRSFVPAMLEQGDEGHIVNTASMAGLMEGIGLYGVSKHAVVALSESLFRELRGRGARLGVSVLCPGWVRTRIMESDRNRPEAPRPDPGPRAHDTEQMRQVVGALVGSGLDPRDVGETVAQAMLEERFYILTHPTWKNMIENRVRNILNERDPQPVPPSGQVWPPLADS